MRISHIINPVAVDNSSDLFIAQPVTFKSMQVARDYSHDQVSTNIYSAQYAEDRALVPDHLKTTTDLQRSVLDFGNFQKKRKLPLIKDILDRLYASDDSDVMIYSNVDIALMPHFYISVMKIIESGYDAFVINRRTIPKNFTTPEQLYLMYPQMGEKHPGYDCFVFKRNMYPEFNLGKAVIGANWIGRVLISNLICHAKRFNVFEDLHLTFHIGDDRSWKTPENSAFDNHNEKELHRILLDYKNRGLVDGKPLVKKFLHQIEHPPQTQLNQTSKARQIKNTIKNMLIQAIQKI